MKLHYKNSIAQNNVNKTTNSLAYSTSNRPMLQEVTERSRVACSVASSVKFVSSCSSLLHLTSIEVCHRRDI